MALDFSVIVNVRHQFGPKDQDVGVFAGLNETFTFNCPDVVRGADALLQFQSRGVSEEQAVEINGRRIFGGIPAGSVVAGGTDVNTGPGVGPHVHGLQLLDLGWSGNVMIVNPGTLKAQANTLRISSSGDTFIIDNVVIVFKVR